MASVLSQAQSLVPPDSLRRFLRGQKPYVVNRERAAVVLGPTVAAYDTFVKAKPYLFVGSSIGALVSAFMLYKRRRSGPESWTLWGASFAACSTVAWFTRPVKVPPGYGPAPGEPTSPLLAYLDAQRAAKAMKDPQWADKVYGRIAAMPGIRETLDQNPMLKAIVV